MARKLPPKDVVIIGLGWTGSILGYELAKAGLDVVAIERGPWRDTATDFPPAYAQDELRYAVRLDLFLRPDQETLTFRNNDEPDRAADPQLCRLPSRQWRRRRRRALERADLALSADRFQPAQPSRAALRQGRPARRHDDPGLAAQLRRDSSPITTVSKNSAARPARPAISAGPSRPAAIRSRAGARRNIRRRR